MIGGENNMPNIATSKRVLVFGSYVTDLCGRASCFPQPGETIKGNCFKLGPGGKGSNQAVAAKRAGADVTFITKLGNDTLGRKALEFYEAEKMATDSIFIDDSKDTGAALIVVNEQTLQNQIVVIGGACENFVEEDMPGILRQVAQADILLLQLETNMEPVRAILKYARECGTFIVLNPAPAQILEDELYRCVDIITPNETEAQFLTGVQVTDQNSAQKAAQELICKGVEKVVITMGSKGAYAHDRKQEQFVDVVDCGAVVDTTGAGDAFSGGLVAALAQGFDFFDAVVYGSTVAGIAVTRQGTAPAMPYREEIDEMFTGIKGDDAK